ncbi:MAG TPA: hypothetical protein IAD49_03080 [Candidatus Fimihabitans intestinipullorum]|uniref:Uncharacterized protein n=1 Tax=Candidatus Fimihabitans intestinipullorum TaxID=2840820 RepID=A0A9D1HUI5_9BACT|nr:hypothetical protein [Candidatus Fimihabitans intestinipullorum]
MNRKIEYRNCTVVQNSNNHVIIFQNNEIVFHASLDKGLTDDELREQVDFYLDILLSNINESRG